MGRYWQLNATFYLFRSTRLGTINWNPKGDALRKISMEFYSSKYFFEIKHEDEYNLVPR
jgi:hypothetical protein